MTTNETPTFSDDDLGFIHLAPTAVIVAVVRGDVDLNAMARRELANRGLDLQGRWVGFDRANRLLADMVTPTSTTAPSATTNAARRQTRRLR